MNALDYAQKHADAWLAELEELARIPSVSTDPAFAADVKRAAEWLAERMRTAGLAGIEVAATAGHPVVYGEWLGAGEDAPTVLLYAHYDVQPAVREDGWDSDPFEPTRRDGKIFARGIGDDKIHSVMIIKVAEALLASDDGSPVNLKLVIEGEEEMGSPNFAPWVRANRERLAADHCLVCDGGIPSKDQPGVIHALRGMLALQVNLVGPRADLHSGSNGGMVHNPAQVIAEIVARLHDEDGRVAVPGFYDDVAELDSADRALVNNRTYGEPEFRAEIGAPASWGEPGYSLLELISIRPTLEINGIYGGYTGDGMKTVIPSRASAKITCRLVPDQKPDVVFERIRSFLEEIAPPTVSIEVVKQGGGDALVIPAEGPLVQSLIRAFTRHWDAEPSLVRMGGSIPIVPVIYNELGISSLPLGFNVAGAGFHGPNEFIHPELFAKGLDTLILMLGYLG
jgi:acetylornithine deacetylase/succinyl-diaminopimelate desuccinylase-like protein